MSYKTSMTSSESESDHFNETVEMKMRPTVSKPKTNFKRKVEKPVERKINKRKPVKTNTSYRDAVDNLLKAEDYDKEVFNSITFRQGDGIVTIKNIFEEMPSDYWTLNHYKSSSIENIPAKDRWKHSEATVKLYTSDKSKDQTLNTSLNQTIQTIFDAMLQDPNRRTIKSKLSD